MKICHLNCKKNIWSCPNYYRLFKSRRKDDKRGRNGGRGKHGKGENEKMERGKEESKEKKKGRGKNVS